MYPGVVGGVFGCHFLYFWGEVSKCSQVLNFRKALEEKKKELERKAQVQFLFCNMSIFIFTVTKKIMQKHFSKVEKNCKKFPKTKMVHMGVSKNRGGPPKSSILIGFSIINHPFWGSIIFGNTHILFVFFPPWKKRSRVTQEIPEDRTATVGCSYSWSCTYGTSTCGGISGCGAGAKGWELGGFENWKILEVEDVKYIIFMYLTCI